MYLTCPYLKISRKKPLMHSPPPPLIWRWQGDPQNFPLLKNVQYNGHTYYSVWTCDLGTKRIVCHCDRNSRRDGALGSQKAVELARSTSTPSGPELVRGLGK